MLVIYVFLTCGIYIYNWKTGNPNLATFETQLRDVLVSLSTRGITNSTSFILSYHNYVINHVFLKVTALTPNVLTVPATKTSVDIV